MDDKKIVSKAMSILGTRSSKKLTKEERVKRARKAALSRWEKKKEK